tara:strand:+ start:717 stop:989 length:273 start_codon:yes stop_codon:yes gene_type:complete
MAINELTEITKVQTFKNGTKHLRVEDKLTGKFLRYEREVCDDPIMYFGKYKGMKFSEILIENEGYLDWLLTQDWLKDNLKNTIIEFMTKE